MAALSKWFSLPLCIKLPAIIVNYFMPQRGAEEARKVHNLEVVGSNPTAASSPHGLLTFIASPGCELFGSFSFPLQKRRQL